MFATIQSALTGDLGLVKKSAPGVPKLFSTAQKDERVRQSENLLQLLRWHSRVALNNIVTMDASNVSFLTPETKRQAKQWVKKGQPGPLKAKVHASRTKQMVLVVFDAKAVIFTNFVPKGEIVNASYIQTALARFLKVFRHKRSIMATQERGLHWDNAPVNNAVSVMDFLVAKGVRMVPHLPYSLYLAPADFFLFPRVKAELAGLILTQQTFKNTREGGHHIHHQGRLVV
jgi:hypothetical protein